MGLSTSAAGSVFFNYFISWEDSCGCVSSFHLLVKNLRCSFCSVCDLPSGQGGFLLAVLVNLFYYQCLSDLDSQRHVSASNQGELECAL